MAKVEFLQHLSCFQIHTPPGNQYLSRKTNTRYQLQNFIPLHKILPDHY